jgi:hypothetical protein
LSRKKGFHMLVLKRHIVAVALFAAVAMLAAMSPLAPNAGASSSPSVADAIAESVFGRSVVANTYVSTGAGATVNGDVVSGTYLTGGAGTTVTGTHASGGVFTPGAGSTYVGGALGAESGLTTQLATAQTVLDGLSSQTLIATGNIATGAIYAPGVYNVNGLLTFTANTTITLDAGGDADAVFVFNVDSYLTFGAGVKVEVTNGGANATVIWNSTGGYISVGADAEIVGIVLAHTYVSTGAGSTVSGSGTTCGNTCGAVYSTTSYVSVGANFATVGDGPGCTPKCPAGLILNGNPDTVELGLDICVVS